MQTIPLGPVRAITFDMYGTLLDLVASFGAGFEEFLEGKADFGGADDVIQAGGHLPSREQRRLAAGPPGPHSRRCAE